MATVKVDVSNFQSEVLDSAEPVVVDFWAEWCGQCKMIAPSLEEIAVEMAGKVKVAKLNIDENPELAAKIGVRSIPTLAIFKAGEVADIKVGAAPKSALSSWISNADCFASTFYVMFKRARFRPGFFISAVYRYPKARRPPGTTNRQSGCAVRLRREIPPGR